MRQLNKWFNNVLVMFDRVIVNSGVVRQLCRISDIVFYEYIFDTNQFLNFSYESIMGIEDQIHNNWNT